MVRKQTGHISLHVHMVSIFIDYIPNSEVYRFITLVSKIHCPLSDSFDTEDYILTSIEGSDRTGRMCRLNWAFNIRISSTIQPLGGFLFFTFHLRSDALPRVPSGMKVAP